MLRLDRASALLVAVIALAPLPALAQPAGAGAAPPAPEPPAASPAAAAKPEGERGGGSDSAAPDQIPTPGGPDTIDAADEPKLKQVLRFRVGPLLLSPVLLVQVDAIPYLGADALLESGDVADRPGFRLRRARLGFEGRLYDRVPFGISAEFSTDQQGTARLHDAWFGYDHFKPVQAFAGAMAVPFSVSALTHSGDTAMIDRPLVVRTLSPGHQLGAQVEGHLFSRALNYSVGVYNGLSRYDYFFQGYVENAGVLGNRFDGLTYAGRLSTEPLGSLGPTIADLHHSKLRVAVGANGFYSNGGTRNVAGFGGDVLLHVAGFHFLGEFLGNRTSPTTQPSQVTGQISSITSLGAVVEAGYMIFRERLGVNARFEWIEPDTTVKDQNDNWLVGGCVSYHVLHDLLKAQVEYMHREEMHGKSLQNDYVALQLQFNLH